MGGRAPPHSAHARANVRALARTADGPFFLGGAEPSLVDVFFAPFLERMAASLPYFKGLRVRDPDAYPNIEAWFVGMEGRPAYRHIQSDFYTHVHDLPPQIGRCHQVDEARPYADAIDGADGASWALWGGGEEGSAEGGGGGGGGAAVPLIRRLQPTEGLGQDAGSARREAAERLMANHEAVSRFAARGLGRPGLPPVSAPLSDPRAAPDEGVLPLVDAALRHVVHALLEGTPAAEATLSSGIEPRAAAAALGYLRDRVSVRRRARRTRARPRRARAAPMKRARPQPRSRQPCVEAGTHWLCAWLCRRCRAT